MIPTCAIATCFAIPVWERVGAAHLNTQEERMRAAIFIIAEIVILSYGLLSLLIGRKP